MIAQSDIKVKRKLANKTDNHTVLYKHHAGRISVQLNNGACIIISYPTVEVKHIGQVYVARELKIN